METGESVEALTDEMLKQGTRITQSLLAEIAFWVPFSCLLHDFEY